MSDGFLEELRWRGLLYQQTAEDELTAHLAEQSRTGYCGFDPTADSLTIGNLIAIKLLMHWQQHGHRPIVVMGGGTGLIGDPSGKDAERPLITNELVEANIVGQRRIFEKLLDFDTTRSNRAEIVNNAEWLGQLGFIEMLRDVGKHFSVNAMIARDSVRKRLEDRAHGISYTEFSYMLLQAYDFPGTQAEPGLHRPGRGLRSIRKHRRGHRSHPARVRRSVLRRDVTARNPRGRAQDREE